LAVTSNQRDQSATSGKTPAMPVDDGPPERGG